MVPSGARPVGGEAPPRGSAAGERRPAQPRGQLAVHAAAGRGLDRRGERPARVPLRLRQHPPRHAQREPGEPVVEFQRVPQRLGQVPGVRHGLHDVPRQRLPPRHLAPRHPYRRPHPLVRRPGPDRPRPGLVVRGGPRVVGHVPGDRLQGEAVTALPDDREPPGDADDVAQQRPDVELAARSRRGQLLLPDGLDQRHGLLGGAGVDGTGVGKAGRPGRRGRPGRPGRLGRLGKRGAHDGPFGRALVGDAPEPRPIT
jgi:hypothetical protein